MINPVELGRHFDGLWTDEREKKETVGGSSQGRRALNLGGVQRRVPFMATPSRIRGTYSTFAQTTTVVFVIFSSKARRTITTIRVNGLPRNKVEGCTRAHFL